MIRLSASRPVARARGFLALGALLSVLLVVGGLRSASGEPASPPAVADSSKTVVESISEEVRSLFEECRGAVVRIRAEDRHGSLLGTGFFIDPAGTLYTSYSIGGESREITVEVGDKKYSASRLLADARSGIALLKVEAETPFLALGDSTKLSVAEPVVAIGYPMDLAVTPSFGTVGGFDLRYLGRYFSTTHIRANVPVHRGEGGAPLLNMNREVVGILISSIDSGAACYVLPVHAAEKIRSDFVRFGEVRHGWVGVNVTGASAPVEGSSAEVFGLEADTPASESGIRDGDVILQVGSHPVRAPADVLDASFFLTAGDEVDIRILRDGARQTIRTFVGRHPLSPKLHAQTPLDSAVDLQMSPEEHAPE